MTQAPYNVIIASCALSLAYAATLAPNFNSTVKIVNSTNIRELKHNFAAEDKSGAVSYVYPVGTPDVLLSGTHQSALKSSAVPEVVNEKLTAAPSSKPSDVAASPSEVKENVAVTSTTAPRKMSGRLNDKTDEVTPKQTTFTQNSSRSNQTNADDIDKPECITRVEPSVDAKTGDGKLIVYNATRQEVEAMGLEVFDTVCKGDIDWDKVISAGALASLCCG